jgi:autotransporter-associated beta strand protein
MKNRKSATVRILAPKKLSLVFACAAALTLVLPATTQAESYNWVPNPFVRGVTYTWADASNWTPSTAYPNAVGDVADLSNTPFNGTGDPAYLALPPTITIGTLKLGAGTASSGPPNYVCTLAINGGTLIMDASSGNALINLLSRKSSFAINCDMQLMDNLEVSCTPSSSYDVDLTIDGIISGSGKSLTKTGNGPLYLGGANTYSGNTTVSEGTLELKDGGSLLMDINDGSWTRLLGTGTLNLKGRLNLDVDDVTASGPWDLVDVANLTVTYGATFSIAMNGGSVFTEDNGVWTLLKASGHWTFTEATGMLAYVQPGGTIFRLR